MVVLLTVIATCLLLEVGVGTSSATAQDAVAGARGGVFAVAGQVSRDTYGLFLVDTQNSTIGVYEFVPDKLSGRKLRLVAARNFGFDLQLDDYNTEPLPREMKTLVEQHRRLNSATTQP